MYDKHCTQSINDIKAKATEYFNSLQTVTVNNIGEGATIYVTSHGNLIINGSVGEKVSFYISGYGNILFSQHPPQSVTIKELGQGQAIMPKDYEKKSASSFSVNYAPKTTQNPSPLNDKKR